MPFVFGRNLPCQPVRGVNTREERHWSHAWQRFMRSKGVKLNDILERKSLSKNAHRTLFNLSAAMNSSFLLISSIAAVCAFRVSA
jgi:hypothetical protein